MNDQVELSLNAPKRNRIIWFLGVPFLLMCFLCLAIITGWQLLLFSKMTMLSNATLDPKCNKYECLKVCIKHLPNIVGLLDPGKPVGTEPIQPGGDVLPAGTFDLAIYKIKGNNLKLISSPPVPDRLKEFQSDTTLHHKIWDYYTTIIPESARTVLTSFTVYTDGQNNGSIMSTEYAPPYYYISVDLFDLDRSSAITSSFVHETGHVLTINTSQVALMGLDYSKPIDLKNFQQTQKECGHYYSGNHCALANSYLDAFYERFWKDRHDIDNYNLYFARHFGKDVSPIAEQMLKNYPNEFLREHAAAELTEDVAVSFENFVLGPKPTGEQIVAQKSLFFYEFPELVKLREQIIQGICGYAAKQQ